MTVPTETDPFPPEQTEEPPPPFESALTFDITKKINMTQLTDEIGAAVKATVQIALSGDADFNSMIDPSPDNVATLSVTPSNVSKAKVQKAIDDHVATDGYELPEHEREFAAVTQKLVDDPTATLTDDEVQVALRALVLRLTMGSDQPLG